MIQSRQIALDPMSVLKESLTEPLYLHNFLLGLLVFPRLRVSSSSCKSLADPFLVA